MKKGQDETSTAHIFFANGRVIGFPKAPGRFFPEFYEGVNIGALIGVAMTSNCPSSIIEQR